MDTPIAQGQDAVAAEVTQAEAAPVAAEPQQASNPHEGFQSRINELVAQRHEADRRAQAMEERLLAILTAQATQQNRPAAEEQLPDMDPDQARIFNAYEARMQKQLQALEQRNYEVMSQLQFHATSQQYGQGEDPAVVQRATQLYQTWQKKGLQGYTPEDAFIYAKGEIAMKGAKQGAANQRLQTFNQGANVTQSHAPPPPIAPRVDSIPADFDDMDPDAQLKILEKRLAGKKF